MLVIAALAVIAYLIHRRDVAYNKAGARARANLFA